MPDRWPQRDGHVWLPGLFGCRSCRPLLPPLLQARDGHQWLHDALTRLHDERVVCVHVQRDATLQRPLGGPVGAAREGEDEASRKARPAIAHGESAR